MNLAQHHKLPNVRKCFIPDPGFEMCESDLAQADARVVAWDANDEILKAIFKDPSSDLHNINAEMIYGKLTPEYRQLAKAGCHATNYGAQATTLARTLGITRHEAELFRRRWFDIHPAIAEWHRRIQSDIECNRCVTNAFGYKRIYFSRVEDAFTEALAWIPQSTVALIITKALITMDSKYPDLIQILLQIHDSTLVQYSIERAAEGRKAVTDAMTVTVPYADPLIIPAGLKVSTKSWGDIQKLAN